MGLNFDTRTPILSKHVITSCYILGLTFRISANVSATLIGVDIKVWILAISITTRLRWYWNGNLNTSLSLPSRLMKDGNSFILDALLLFEELDWVSRYLVTISTCGCFLSAMRSFPLFSVASLAFWTSSHRLFTQFSYVGSEILLGTIFGYVSNNLWDSSTIFHIGFD